MANGRIILRNQLGQKLGEWPIQGVQTRIKTTSFPSGVYTLEIETSSGTIIKSTFFYKQRWGDALLIPGLLNFAKHVIK